MREEKHHFTPTTSITQVEPIRNFQNDTLFISSGGKAENTHVKSCKAILYCNANTRFLGDLGQSLILHSLILERLYI